MSLWRRAARKDETHAEVVGALRAHGCSVVSLNAPGAPDLVVGVYGRTHLIEVKRELGKRGGKSHRELRPNQVAWHSMWRGDKPWILRNTSDVTEWVKARRAEVGGDD